MRKTHRHPLEQRAYEAFRDAALNERPNDDHYGPKAAAFHWEWANFDAVRKGVAEPLPQYRPAISTLG